MKKRKVNNILTAIICATVLICIGLMVYLCVTYKKDIPVEGRYVAYLINRETEEVSSRTTETEVKGHILGSNDRFKGSISLFDFNIHMYDLEETKNGYYYDTYSQRYDDSELFSYNAAFALIKDMNISAYVIGLSEEFSENNAQYCFICNVTDEDEALKVYREMKDDIDYCYNTLGSQLDTYTYQGIVRDTDGNEVDRVDVTINGLYCFNGDIMHYFYGELLVDGYYESGISETEHMTTEYSTDVVFELKNEDGVVAEINGIPGENENISITIKTSNENEMATIYEIECLSQ